MKKTTKMKFCAVVLSAILAISGGCAAEQSSNQTLSNEKIKMETTFVEPKSKIFDKGEHIVHLHIYFGQSSEEYKTYVKQIEVPKGYRLLDVDPYTQDADYGSETAARDYYFENLVPVEVVSQEVDENGNYIYINFGIPIENNQVLSKTQE